ncbi:hypothetical protein O6072_18440 [Mycolicibacterium neoaurum]|uniref:hypothetical protein n=1 Tax=Mycolicibacterium neoaurum TaxID=1795 RepID=UPI00248CA453|nr:hypothetical protein [Mycolicibacterium neoaurum]WBP93199.1 hypothetical protein O7W24_18805 [Mycolicibacterium neoaurum]WBS06834.1 hypothetical protein O6072_18440 [Mycolicibacterium neoaurum]
MIPKMSIKSDWRIPAEATFWMPGAADMDEEGIGYFRDVWLITDVQPSEAREVIQQEQRFVEVVGALASTAEDFDRLARCIERWDPDEEDVEATAHEMSILRPMLSELDFAPLEGLELGVAGAVFALAANGMVPAASCRGHTDTHAWSELPVVLFAADEPHARALELPVRQAGCGFDIDPARLDLLAIQGRSITNLMALATVLTGTAD